MEAVSSEFTSYTKLGVVGRADWRKGMETRRDNHYVPGVYLKRFSSSPGKTWQYRTLVSDSRVPFWEEKSLRSVASQPDLYSLARPGGDSDSIERWLDRDFEAPAEPALAKVLADERLAPEDWERIIRFAMAQDVRTPARFIESLDRWKRQIPTMLDEVVPRSLKELGEEREQAKARSGVGRPEFVEDREELHLLPISVLKGLNPGESQGWVKTEITVGRQLWLRNIKFLLTATIQKIPKSGWTILLPPEGTCWFTSDNPVVRLNFYRDRTYDFKGGWDNPGSEILFPLSPRHLLYRQSGRRSPRRGHVVSPEIAQGVLRFIAENAHRSLFADRRDPRVERLRPRRVNAEQYRSEKEQWERWHREQSEAEMELVRKRAVGDPGSA